MSDIFNPEAAPTQNALETLVGEDKKFKTVDDLAKGKLEADNHIQRLEGELAELRTKVTATSTLEEMLAKLQQTPKPEPTPEPKPEAHQPAKPAGITEDALAEKVRELLEEKDRQSIVQRNVQEVTNRLVSVYGDEVKANEFVRQRAAELQVPLDYLQDVAARSPKAFFELVKVAEPVAPPGPTHGDKNPAALSKHSPGVKPNTYKWYQEIRKTDPEAYKKLQLQMHNDAIKLGEKFYE